MPFSEENIHRIVDEAQIPLTEAQRRLLADEMHESVRRALHTYTRNAIVGFLILLAANIFVWRTVQSLNDSRRADIVRTGVNAREAIVASGRVVSVEGCNRDFQTIKALRGVLATAKTFNEAAAKRGEISPTRLAETESFYAAELGTLQLPDCRVSARTLTANKNAPVREPTPLHP
jgi:hypothetical protein